MSIRIFQPGDEAAQVSIYNEASADLPKFKPATLDEVRRRHRGSDFDPTARFFAIEGDLPRDAGLARARRPVERDLALELAHWALHMPPLRGPVRSAPRSFLAAMLAHWAMSRLSATAPRR